MHACYWSANFTCITTSACVAYLRHGFYKKTGTEKACITIPLFDREKHQGQHNPSLYPRRQICYNILATKRIYDLPISGRPVRKGTKKVVGHIRKLFNNKGGVSTRQAATRLKLSQAYVWKIKNRQLGIKSYRKQRAPKYKEGQEKRAEMGARYHHHHLFIFMVQ